MTSSPIPSRPDARALLATVRNILPTLQTVEHRIGAALLADPERFSHLSISEIAAHSGTSTTSVVRFYKKIGYGRFKDFRHDLTQTAVHERLTAGVFPAEVSDIARGDTLEQVVAKVARDEILSIGDTAELLDTAVLAKAVESIAVARRVAIFGVGGSAIVGVDLQRKLSRIGSTAIEWPEAHVAWTAAAVLGPGSVAVAISHSGETSDTVEFLRLARASGAATVAITNVAGSPLTREADVVLRTAARETAFRSGALGSRVAQLMVVDCLFIGVVQADYDRSLTALRTTYEAVRTRSTRSG